MRSPASSHGDGGLLVTPVLGQGDAQGCGYSQDIHDLFIAQSNVSSFYASQDNSCRLFDKGKYHILTFLHFLSVTVFCVEQELSCTQFDNHRSYI